MNSVAEISVKTDRLREMLENAGATGVLLNAQHNFVWLTGGENAINRSTEAGSGTLFVARDGRRLLLANNIEIERLMHEQVPADLFEAFTIDWRDEKAGPDHLLRACRALGAEPTELLSDLPLAPGIRAAENLIAPCRFSLTEDEIPRYRELGFEAAAAIDAVFDKIEPGMTEREISAITANELARFAIFAPVLLVGADERLRKYRHPVPSENIWRKALLIVVCARRGGLFANLSRMAYRGPVPQELADATGAVRRIFESVCEATRPGATGTELYDVLAEAYRREGYPGEIAKHHQGGATGYKTRDWVAHPTSTDKVQVNQAFAWNPSITGTKAEETLIVHEHGSEFITGRDFAAIREY